MQAITFEVIVSAVFGFDEGGARARLCERLTQLFAIFAKPWGSLLGVPFLQIELGGLAPWGRVVRLKREIDGILYAEFARRRAAGADGHRDVLSLLLATRDDEGRPMTDAQLRDEMLTLLLAGHETTAASLAWVFHRLLTHAEVLQTLRDEIGRVAVAPERLGELPYLDAVIKETTRLDPVIPNVGRHVRAPLRIAGRGMPGGVTLAPCIYLTHRRADLWADPTRFAPERFIGTRVNPSAFFPFGGGVRRCIGAAFATYEMKIVLTAVLSRVALRLAPGYEARLVRRSIAFAPSEGLPVVVTARDGATASHH